MFLFSILIKILFLCSVRAMPGRRSSRIASVPNLEYTEIVEEEESEEENEIIDEAEAGEEDYVPPPPFLLPKGWTMEDKKELFNRNKKGSDDEREVEKNRNSTWMGEKRPLARPSRDYDQYKPPTGHSNPPRYNQQPHNWMAEYESNVAARTRAEPVKEDDTEILETLPAR